MSAHTTSVEAEASDGVDTAAAAEPPAVAAPMMMMEWLAPDGNPWPRVPVELVEIEACYSLAAKLACGRFSTVWEAQAVRKVGEAPTACVSVKVTNVVVGTSTGTAAHTSQPPLAITRSPAKGKKAAAAAAAKRERERAKAPDNFGITPLLEDVMYEADLMHRANLQEEAHAAEMDAEGPLVVPLIRLLATATAKAALVCRLCRGGSLRDELARRPQPLDESAAKLVFRCARRPSVQRLTSRQVGG
jgi:hypothetical protein